MQGVRKRDPKSNMKSEETMSNMSTPQTDEQQVDNPKFRVDSHDELKTPPLEAPRWLKAGLQAHLTKHVYRMSQMNAQFEMLQSKAAAKFIGTTPFPVAKPVFAQDLEPPSRNREHIIPVDGTSGGRSQLVVQVPPATRGPPQVTPGLPRAVEDMIAQNGQGHVDSTARSRANVLQEETVHTFSV